MSQIQSGQKHQAVSFEQKEPRSSMGIMLTDYSLDASWRLRIEFETADGGWFMLGAVDTIPVNAVPIKVPNRLIAVCSVPGVLNWKVYASLNFGTPSRNRSMVEGEMKLGTVPEYAAGCCPLVPIPGVSISVTDEGNAQTPTGAPQIAPRLTLFTGSGWSKHAEVAYLGGRTSFVQQHDAGIGDPVVDETMIGPGYPVAVIAGVAPLGSQTIRLPWVPGRRFTRGFTLALSSTQNTFTATVETMAAFGQWSIFHD